MKNRFPDARTHYEKTHLILRKRNNINQQCMPTIKSKSTMVSN